MGEHLLGVREEVIRAGLTDALNSDAGVRGLLRAAQPGGVFCYTFFEALGRTPGCGTDAAGLGGAAWASAAPAEAVRVVALVVATSQEVYAFALAVFGLLRQLGSDAAVFGAEDRGH